MIFFNIGKKAKIQNYIPSGNFTKGRIMAALDKVTRLLDQTSKAEDKLEVEKVLKRRTFSKGLRFAGQQYNAIEELRFV